MYWLYFSVDKGQSILNLEDTLREEVGVDGICVFHHWKDLEDYLRKPSQIITHALLVMQTGKAIRRMKKFRIPFSEKKLILAVNSEAEKESDMDVSGFHASYVAYLPEDAENIRFVVQRMIRFEKSNTIREGSSLGK